MHDIGKNTGVQGPCPCPAPQGRNLRTKSVLALTHSTGRRPKCRPPRMRGGWVFGIPGNGIFDKGRLSDITFTTCGEAATPRPQAQSPEATAPAAQRRGRTAGRRGAGPRRRTRAGRARQRPTRAKEARAAGPHDQRRAPRRSGPRPRGAARPQPRRGRAKAKPTPNPTKQKVLMKTRPLIFNKTPVLLGIEPPRDRPRSWASKGRSGALRRSRRHLS